MQRSDRTREQTGMRQRHHHKKGFELLRSNSETIAHKTRMGFSLVEAAIVLGVVGLVVGGIWYGAASVIENQKVNRHSEQLIGIIMGLNALFAKFQIPDTDENGLYITSAIISANIIPKDMVTASNKATNPFEGSFDIKYIYNKIQIVTRGLEYKSCNRVINNLIAFNSRNKLIISVMMKRNDDTGSISFYMDEDVLNHPLCYRDQTNKIFILLNI